MLSYWLYAYIDPVSGSILLQVIAAGVLGAFGYFFRPLWRVARRLFGSKPPQGDPSAGQQDKTG